MKKILVIYHKNCPDGFGAAWAARKKFGAKAEYLAAAHPSSPPKDLKGREVYMVDYCYSEDKMKSVLKSAAKVVVLDHHVSQREAVKVSTEYVFGETNSGAILAWKYFFPKKSAPKLLLHIQDNDTWKFALKGTREYLAYLDTLPFDLKTWDKLIKDFENPDKRKEFFNKGSSILSFSKQNIETLSSTAEWVKFAGRKCLAVNSPVFVSEIGHVLATKAKGIGIVWCKKGDKLKVSLRSNGKVDVSRIALKYGGGGHKAAASFVIDASNPLKLPWK
ncbi:MAG: DHHA1 domain-containing protein [Parcubacteria group bacterium]